MITDPRSFSYHPPFPQRSGEPGLAGKDWTPQSHCGPSSYLCYGHVAARALTIEITSKEITETLPYPAVSLQCLHKGIVCFCIKIQPLVHVLKEVQVLKCGVGFLSLFSGCSPLVCGPFEVIGQVHPHGPRQHIVHHYNPDVDAARLHAI